MSDEQAAVAGSAFCGACGAAVEVDARFCPACGADQQPFQESGVGIEPEPAPATEPAPQAEPEPAPTPEPGALGPVDALIERHGFGPSQPPRSAGFAPAGVGAIGVLAALPVRVDEARRPAADAPLIRVRIGLAHGDPKAVERGLGEVDAWRVAVKRAGVEVLATAVQCGGGEGAAAYCEDLAQRVAAAMKPEQSAPPGPTAGAFTVSGFPQWVETADTTAFEGVDLRHFEVRGGEAEWEELGVSLAASADGAIYATGTWDEEAPYISIMGRVVLMHRDANGREKALMFGSGICTLTNRRLLAVVYSRPDDDVLEGLGQSMSRSGITMRDARGRPVNPFTVMSEEQKTFQFIDEGGAVDDEGGGVVLALSAFPGGFATVDLDGGVLQRGIGIPGIVLRGSPLELRVIPFRVLDGDSNTVKPRRNQIKEAVHGWWAMMMSYGSE